jgi:hypothetical protein
LEAELNKIEEDGRCEKKKHGKEKKTKYRGTNSSENSYSPLSCCRKQRVAKVAAGIAELIFVK